MPKKKAPEDGKKYTFCINAVIMLGVTVVAKDLDDAIAKAKAAPIQSLCHQCSKGEEDEWSTSGELDCGDPGECELVDFHHEDLSPSNEEHLFPAVEKLWKGEG